MLKSNPLRISHESLDLDDIISDLNSEMSNLQLPQRQVIDTVTKPGPIPSKQSKVPAKQQQPSVKTHLKHAGKENDSIIANSSTVVKSKGDHAHGGTTDTKASALMATTESSIGQGNQRYSDSNIKSMGITEEDDTLRIATPFYMKGQQQLTQDEDVESFQRKLDTMIVNFRSETLSEFMKTKKQVLQDQAQTIDAERRRCNTLLGVKQSEIEQLKESLGAKTKLCEDLGQRCEGMAFWSGKSKMLLRIKLLQHRAFDGLKKNRDFINHTKRVLEHRLRQYRQDVKKRVFLGWEKQYKQWKIVKNSEDFDKAVKLELQQICAQYNKEIESLRDKLGEASQVVESEHRNKAMMQENLKKAFMRGVCALNYEAMNILNPNDQGYQQQVEREMEKQVTQALNNVASQQSPQFQSQSETLRNSQMQSYNQNEQQFSPQSNGYDFEDKRFNAAEPVNPFVSLTDNDYKKVESKDSMWKPAPIMGRDFNQQIVPSYTYSQPTITSQLKRDTATNVVLSSHFNNRPAYNADLSGLSLPQVTVVNEDTNRRTLPGNPTFVNSSLPDFVAAGMQGGGEGKKIFAGATDPKNQPSKSSTLKKSVVTAVKKGK